MSISLKFMQKIKHRCLFKEENFNGNIWTRKTRNY